MNKPLIKYRKIPSRAVGYDGYQFKSKLEAIWALYFNSLNIKYIYEPSLFKLKYRNKILGYIPDFYFPELKIYAEVKPLKFSILEDRKINLLVEQANVKCLKLIGIPKNKFYICVEKKKNILGFTKKIFDSEKIIVYSKERLEIISQDQQELLKGICKIYRNPL